VRWWDWLMGRGRRSDRNRDILHTLNKEIEVESAEQESAEILAEVIRIHPKIDSDRAHATERVAREHAERRARLERQRDLLLRHRHYGPTG
jgi:hypothetical protein